MLRNSGFRLATVAGIPISVDVSFFVSFVLITSIFGLSILPNAVDPDPSTLTTILLSLLAGLVFFASLLMHELAHSILARAYGLHVRGITLFLLGGISQITEESKTPFQEFLIAFVGPLMSAALSGIFFGIYYLTGAGDSSLAAVVFWLGFVNALLAAFNMLPGFPLDGGRVFRSVIWGVTGSRTRSTRYAARVGQVVGAGIAGLGVASLLIDFGSGGFGGFWMILIGGFLYNGAAQSHRMASAEERLDRVHVRDVMSTQLRTVEASTGLRWLAPQRDRIDHNAAYLIMDDETVVGILTGAQIAILDEQEYLHGTVRDVMVGADAFAPIDPGATGHEALERLQESRAQVLPVVENGRLLGLVGLEQMLTALRGSQPTPA
jgi:Zn-dependent protease